MQWSNAAHKTCYKQLMIKASIFSKEIKDFLINNDANHIYHATHNPNNHKME